MNDEEKVALLQHFMGWLNGMGYAVIDEETPRIPPSSIEVIEMYLDTYTLEGTPGEQLDRFLDGLYAGQQTRARFDADHAEEERE